MVPTLALVRGIRKATELPVVTSGGIMSGQEIAGALRQGACAAALGTAFLACPAGYCSVAEAAPSPVFAVSADRLAGYWAEMIAAEPRLVQIAAQPMQRRLVYIQRSAVLRFPDLITVE